MHLNPNTVQYSTPTKNTISLHNPTIDDITLSLFADQDLSVTKAERSMTSPASLAPLHVNYTPNKLTISPSHQAATRKTLQDEKHHRTTHAESTLRNAKYHRHKAIRPDHLHLAYVRTLSPTSHLTPHVSNTDESAIPNPPHTHTDTISAAPASSIARDDIRTAKAPIDAKRLRAIGSSPVDVSAGLVAC